MIRKSDRADERAHEHVMLAKFKRARFASLACAYKACFDVDAEHRRGDQLFVNVQANPGQVRVAIAQQSSPYHLERRKDESLPGFSFDDCVPFTGDSDLAPVRFRNASIASIPADIWLILRFEVAAGEVFGYEWRNP